MKKPDIRSEAAFEVLASGCTYLDPSVEITCDPDFGFYVTTPSSAEGALGIR